MSNKDEGLYGRRLPGKWREAFNDSLKHDYETILKESFHVSHGRILSQLEGAGKFSSEAKTLLQACEVLVEQGELTFDFVEELKLRLLGLDLQGMLRAFQGTLSLADGAERLARAGDVRRQLEICKGFLVAVLRTSNDKNSRELALNCIQQLKLDANLPVEQLEILMKEAQREVIEDETEEAEEEETDPVLVVAEQETHTEKEALNWGSYEVPENILERDIWSDENN